MRPLSSEKHVAQAEARRGDRTDGETATTTVSTGWAVWVVRWRVAPSSCPLLGEILSSGNAESARAMSRQFLFRFALAESPSLGASVLTTPPRSYPVRARVPLLYPRLISFLFLSLFVFCRQLILIFPSHSVQTCRPKSKASRGSTTCMSNAMSPQLLLAPLS